MYAVVRSTAVGVLGAALVVALAACGGGSSKPPYVPPSSSDLSPSTSPAPPVPQEVLSIGDMPTGWTVDNDPSTTLEVLPTCIRLHAVKVAAQTYSGATFLQGKLSPFFDEYVGYFPGDSAQVQFDAANKAMDACTSATYTVKKVQIKASISQTSLPGIGDASSAYTAFLSSSSFSATAYVAIIRDGHQLMIGTFGAAGTTSIAAVQSLASLAASKLSIS